MRRKSLDSPMREANVTGKLSIGVVKFYNDGVVQAVIRISQYRSPISPGDEFLVIKTFIIEK